MKLVKRKNTLFKKYFRINLIIILVSFLIAGFSFMPFITKYWEEEKKDILTKNAISLADMIQKNSEFSGNDIFFINKILIEEFLSLFSENIADVFIINEKGEIVFYSTKSDKKLEPKKFSDEIINKAFTDKYIGISDFSKTYDHPCYGVGIPLKTKSNGEFLKIGAVFTISDARYMFKFRENFIDVFVLLFLVIFLTSMLAAIFISYKISKPLKEMSLAANSFAKGDFSKRILSSETDEIGQLAFSFNNMADSLHVIENTRRNFIANVSHELRTPITVISGFVDGILDGTIKEKSHYLKIVSNETKRLSRLISSMFKLSNIEFTDIKFNKKKVNVTKILSEIVWSFKKQIESKNVKLKGFDYKKTFFLYSDADAIYQVMYNLIENSVKFVENKGTIYFEIKDDNKRLTFLIGNTGNGIKNQDINFIFDKFYKTDKSRNLDKSGLGLGLYITKKIILLLKGNISVKSEYGKYCEFSFYLPK